MKDFIGIILFTLALLFFGICNAQVSNFPWTHDFENATGLNEVSSDDGDWALWSGATYSPNTGPQGDHTTGTGMYYYTEASVSGIGYPYKTFITYTPVFDISQLPGKIVSFWYHMYGNGMGDLEISIEDYSFPSTGQTILGTISGDQGDEWHLAYFTIPAGVLDSFVVVFKGTTGNWWDSDICIDDIYVGDPYVVGCMDASALNYNASAVVDDGSCLYPPCAGFVNSNAYQMCWGNQAAIQFEWEGDTTYSQCDVTTLHIGDANGWSVFFPGYWPATVGWSGFAVAVGNGQMPPNWSVEHYCVLEYVDGTFSDTIFFTPSPCITGCMDSTQTAYNPWATIDDGSCSGTTCDPTTEYQITINITLDNWPSETGWELVTNAGPNVQTPSGTYTYNDIGVTYTYTHCVSSTAGFEFILTDTYGDGMMGMTPPEAGEIVIYDCNGDTITYLSGGTWVDGTSTPVGVNFGTVAYSTPLSGVACATPPVIPGCLDPSYQEYNPLANVDDGSCANSHIFGCTDSVAFNYDPAASQMDLIPVCNYTLKIEDDAADGWGNSYIGVVQGNNTWTYTMGPGNYVQNYPINLETDKPVMVYYFEIPNAQNPDPLQTTFQTMQNSFTLTNANGVVLLEEGTNPFANNGQEALQGFGPPFWTTYSALPYCGDYCIPKVFGCMDSTALNYNPNANTPDTCIAVIYGCTNNLAVNFDPVANTDDGSCIPFVFGCMDSIAWNFNSFANVDDGSCIYFGCTDSTALNYDSTANTDNGTCIYPTIGCTDPSMFNYNPAANVDDGSCIPFNYGCTDPTAFNYDSIANTENGSCIPVIFGCIDSTQFNYDPLANTDNGSCIAYLHGCTDPLALNYNASANTLDNSCCYLGGCTDSTALNFDPDVCFNDGSCITIIEGCTDVDAYNYDPTANVSDLNACLYSAGCITGDSIPYWLNDQCYAWVIVVDPYCCETEWDEICQATYNYCYDGWTGNLPPARLNSDQIIVYPNPTTDKIYVNKNVDLKMFNSLGDIIASGYNINVLDVSKINPGMYMIHIIYNNKTFIKNIIKK
ncbi:putative peptidase [uncultured virus]|uniref:Putative peptidase n=1 Tax=uncultured virus TaxID=340016 RepID=A0A218ML01_9VIRU|nr:putative peptidase [uncultured virus]